MSLSAHEAALAVCLRDLPRDHDFRWSTEVDRHIRQILFRSLVGNDNSRLSLLFPGGPPRDPAITWTLREAQGAVEGAEYTEAARGRPCGHIFNSGESTYLCKTCAFDETCVLCARCFTESDHEGHEIYVSVSPGNSGCCDCGDDEAWARPVWCTIHKAAEESDKKSAGKTPQAAGLPDDLVQLVHTTIEKVLDYICDVFSCSPEQLRLQKTQASVEEDEARSRLNPDRYCGPETLQEPPEYALVLWNDEKHTLDGVREQLARACKMTRELARQKAMEVDQVGRSVVQYSTDLPNLLQRAQIIEQIKLSVTVRSARDTFRERMCESMLDWLSDISGCSMGTDGSILKHTICTALLGRWNVGSQKFNALVGQSGIHDHEFEERKHERDMYNRYLRPLQAAGVFAGMVTNDDDDEDDDDTEMGDAMDEDDEGDEDADAIATVNELVRTNRETGGLQLQAMDVQEVGDTIVFIPRGGEADVDMDDEAEDTANEVQEATIAGYPPPPPPPPHAGRQREASIADSQLANAMTPQGSDDGDSNTKRLAALPKTPRHHKRNRRPKPPQYWLARPRESLDQGDRPLAENLWERLRIDHLILYDLRLWKTLRILLRHLYISTMVTVPEFKRILGLRFAGLYTMLSQLYLIADREPDLSIIHLSVQLMTTPSIGAEVIDRANFLTNLLAILYTFLTTRQVGYPKDVSETSTLAFDAGTVTNRRLFHFYTDIKYMFQSPFVREKIRNEPQYLLQFLDLVKLHQGICPNLRAVGEHVEYETDAWASASSLIKEIVRFCHSFAQGYISLEDEDLSMLVAAVRSVGSVATSASLGLESKRFTSSELKSELTFKQINGLLSSGRSITLPNIRVLNESMSFHHPLHYLLSWLLQAGKMIPPSQVRQLLLYDGADLKVSEYPSALQLENGPFAPFVGAHERLSAMFDMPLRVMAWQAQIRSDMWVRNGLTLRHQMHAYRNSLHRDLCFTRDLFMLQVALVVCDADDELPGERFLAQIIDRFDLTNWAQFEFEKPQGFETAQHIDVIEEFFNLLVILLSEREELLPDPTGEKPTIRAIQRDIAHTLCFKPLSYSDLTARLTDQITNSDKFDAVMKSMTRYRAPGGLSDSGTFELLPDYIELVDPYHVFYTRNMREDSESIIKDFLAKRTGKDKSDVVVEPRLAPITSGLFAELSAFTRTPLFARTICATLRVMQVSTDAEVEIPVPNGRFEAFLPVLLHLILIAISEDTPNGHDGRPSFMDNLFTKIEGHMIMEILQDLSQVEKFSACHPRLLLIISRVQERCPHLFTANNIRPLSTTTSAVPDQTEDRETKKRQAMERQAKVMAQFKEQQSSFLNNQGIDWGVDDSSDVDDDMHMDEETATETVRPYPRDPCMLCQEETNDESLYGCFAFVSKSRILRQTPFEDMDYMQEVFDTPNNLDRSADGIRPFGVASENKVKLEKTTLDGQTIVQEHQVLSKGFLAKDGMEEHFLEGPVTTSCGHIMHWSCFDEYTKSIERRHSQQIARNHPERLGRKEFLCPLCKALGNMFIPLVWKPKKETYPGALATSQTFDDWVRNDFVKDERKLETTDLSDGSAASVTSSRKAAEAYVESHFTSKIATSIRAGTSEASSRANTTRTTPTVRQGPLQSLAALLSSGRELNSQAPGEGALSTPPTLAETLNEAFLRIQETFVANSINTNRDETWQKLQTNHEIALADALGYSISAVEIAARGVAGYPSCLSSISDLSLTNLRILSETVSSYVACRHFPSTQLSSEDVHSFTVEEVERQHLAVLLGKDVNFETDSPLLKHDIFIYLTHCSIFRPVEWDRSGHHILRACFLAEMVKVVIALRFLPGVYEQTELDSSDFVTTVWDMWSKYLYDAQGLSPEPEKPYRPVDISITASALQPYAVAFLRKALVLFHIRCGVDFAVVENELKPELSEIDRLTTLLRLPSFEDMIKNLTSSTASGEADRALAERWINHTTLSWNENEDRLTLSHPAIFELVGLPKTFDSLTEEARKRPCPTKGHEISDPAVCLFCGAIFCSQASCCRDKVTNEGGCSKHMRSCGGDVGLFINIRKCMVLFMHGRHGSFATAPYLDKHGEADPTLRRHHQLFLNQKRYDRLFREVWLNHGIQSAISRKLEADINTGGWETL